MVKWPPNRGSKGHFESPGVWSFLFKVENVKILSWTKTHHKAGCFWTAAFFLRLCHPAGNRCQRPRVIEPYSSVFYSETNAKPKPPKLTRIQVHPPLKFFETSTKTHQFLRFQTVRFFRGVSQKIISSSIVCCSFMCQVGTDVQDRFMEDFDRWIASSWKVSECYYGVIMSSWLWAYYFDY